MVRADDGSPTEPILRRVATAVKDTAKRAKSRIAAGLHAASPLGKAEAAHARGDDRFLVELPIDDHTMRTVAGIEAVGWDLQDVNYSTVENTTTTHNSDGTTEVTQSSRRTGIYLFHRATDSE